MRRSLHRLADFIAVADAALRTGKEAVEFRPGVVPQHTGVDARPAGQIQPALRGQGQGIETVVLRIAVALVGLG